MTDTERPANAAGFEPQDHDDVLDIAPVDPDIALFADYLAHALSLEDAAAVEQRLEDDEEFFWKVGPLIKIWHHRKSFRTILAEYEDHEQVRERARQHAIRPEPPRARPRPAWVDYAPAFLGIHRLYEIDEHLSPLPHRWFSPTFRRRFAYMTAAASIGIVAFGLSTLGYTLYVSNGSDVRVQTVPLRAPTAQIINGTVVETKAGEVKELDFRGGSHLSLKPNSRLTFHYVGLSSRGISAALDGEAAVTITREDFAMRIVTSAGSTMLTPGNYAVRCAPGCDAMLLSVGAGMATLRADTAKASMSFRAGDRGRLPREGSPEKVTPGTNWPVVP